MEDPFHHEGPQVRIFVRVAPEVRGELATKYRAPAGVLRNQELHRVRFQLGIEEVLVCEDVHKHPGL